MHVLHQDTSIILIANFDEHDYASLVTFSCNMVSANLVFAHAREGGRARVTERDVCYVIWHGAAICAAPPKMSD